MATANMNLDLPTVGVTVGPTWASQLNTAITSIDSHDHTSGKGVQIPSAALNIDADVDWGNQNITNVTNIGTDTITVGGTLTAGGDVIPSTTNTYDLGSSSAVFAEAWATTLKITTLDGIGSDIGMAANFVPGSDDTYGLGSSSFYWANIYVNDIFMSGAGAAFSLVSGNAEVIIADQHRADTNGSGLWFRKSRSATMGAHTIVQDGDNAGTLAFYGSNGSSFDRCALIEVAIDGTPGGSSDMPGRIVLSTTPDGSASPASAIRIDSSQDTLFYGSIKVNDDSTDDIGTTGSRWRAGYFDKIIAGDDVAAQTTAGERSLRNTVHAWATADATAGPGITYVAADSYNISAVSRTGTGQYDCTITAYTGDLAVIASLDDQSTPFILQASKISSTNIRVISRNTSGTATDIPSGVTLSVVGLGY